MQTSSRQIIKNGNFAKEHHVLHEEIWQFVCNQNLSHKMYKPINNRKFSWNLTHFHILQSAFKIIYYKYFYSDAQQNFKPVSVGTMHPIIWNLVLVMLRKTMCSPFRLYTTSSFPLSTSWPALGHLSTFLSIVPFAPLIVLCILNSYIYRV